MFNFSRNIYTRFLKSCGTVKKSRNLILKRKYTHILASRPSSVHVKIPIENREYNTEANIIRLKSKHNLNRCVTVHSFWDPCIWISGITFWNRVYVIYVKLKLNGGKKIGLKNWMLFEKTGCFEKNWMLFRHSQFWLGQFEV